MGKIMWDVVAGRELTPGGLRSMPIPAAAREVALVCARRTAECCRLNTADSYRRENKRAFPASPLAWFQVTLQMNNGLFRQGVLSAETAPEPFPGTAILVSILR